MDMKEKNIFKRFDNYILQIVNTKMKTRALDLFFPKYTQLAGVGFLCVLVFTLYMMADSVKQKAFVIELGFLQVLTAGIVHIMKFLAKRVRPYDLLEGLNTFDIFLPDYSFPSGHTAAACSIATVISYYYPGFVGIFIIYATLIGISRMYLAVHFPTDVLVGAFVGILITTLGHNFISPMVLNYVLN